MKSEIEQIKEAINYLQECIGELVLPIDRLKIEKQLESILAPKEEEKELTVLGGKLKYIEEWAEKAKYSRCFSTEVQFHIKNLYDELMGYESEQKEEEKCPRHSAIIKSHEMGRPYDPMITGNKLCTCEPQQKEEEIEDLIEEAVERNVLANDPYGARKQWLREALKRVKPQPKTFTEQEMDKLYDKVDFIFNTKLLSENKTARSMFSIEIKQLLNSLGLE